jgi:hypothetical protein
MFRTNSFYQPNNTNAMHQSSVHILGQCGSRLVSVAVLSLTFIGCAPDQTPPSESSLTQVSTFVSFKPSNPNPLLEEGSIEQVQFGKISGIAFDNADNLYMADYSKNRIRKMSADGKTVSTFAGSGVYDLSDGSAASATFAGPLALLFDQDGSLYVTHFGAVRKITPDRVVSTLIGVKPLDVSESPVDSLAIYNPYGITIDNKKNIYVTDFEGASVIKVTPNQQASSFAGGPLFKYRFQTSTKPKILLNAPNNVLFNPIQKNIYIIDALRGIIRVDLDGAGGCISSCKRIYDHKDGPITEALFQIPNAGIFDKVGNLYVADENYIRKITPDGIVSTIAGTGKPGFKDGSGDQAEFDMPSYLAFDSKGNLYASDRNGVKKLILPK